MASAASSSLDYGSFCQLHEDVLEWLLDVEDKLADMPDVVNSDSRSNGERNDKECGSDVSVSLSLIHI